MARQKKTPARGKPAGGQRSSAAPAGSERPALDAIGSGTDLKRWYWLKAELETFARANGLPAAGQKPELTERIAHWLDTGEVRRPTRRRAESSFDWAKDVLTPTTPITDSYRNTRNVREFMEQHAGARFRFSNEFMAWMRNNTGRPLSAAVDFWRDLDHRKRNDGYREQSLPQNQYAQFSRAVSQARPGISARELRRLWQIKRSGPAPHTYRPGDEYL
ncbi:MAG: DUF6434 domain-containing protein [Pseudomonadota bacterium]